MNSLGEALVYYTKNDNSRVTMVNVSVVIINYNAFDLTVSCINSILEKTNEINFEIILVDNASKEKDPRHFKELFPDIHLLISKKNLGFSKGCNYGISHARGEYILLLNNDTLLANNAIKISFDFLMQNSSVGVVSSKLIYPDGKIQHCCQRFPSVKYKLAELLRIQKIIGKRRGGQLLMGSFFDHQEIAYPDWIWGTFFMFPAEILNHFSNKLLPETFFMYWEDVEWCKEIQNMGYKVAYFPYAQVIHLMGSSKGAKNKMMVENKKIFMSRYYNKVERFIIDILDKCLA